MFHYTIGGREVARCIFIEFLSCKNFAIHFLERGACVLKVSILAYRGTMSIQGGWTRNLVGFGTTWLMRITDECTRIEAHSIPMCNVVANTSKLAHSLRPQVTLIGVYYRINYDVILLFGLTELKAQISWKHEVRLFIVPVLTKPRDLLLGV